MTAYIHLRDLTLFGTLEVSIAFDGFRAPGSSTARGLSSGTKVEARRTNCTRPSACDSGRLSAKCSSFPSILYHCCATSIIRQYANMCMCISRCRYIHIHMWTYSHIYLCIYTSERHGMATMPSKDDIFFQLEGLLSRPADSIIWWSFPPGSCS